jgi:hypothetical protein
MTLTQSEIQRRYKERHPERVNETQKKYRQSEKGKECQHRKNTSEIGRERHKRYEATEKGKQNNIKKCKVYYQRHTEQIREYNFCRRPNKDKNRERARKWAKTENGKRVRLKNQHIRKRKLGFNILFENKIDEPFAWHHIDNKNVVAIPKDLHELFTRGKDVHRHRNELIFITEQLYPELKKEKGW